jgi:hypothetical protein
LLAVIAASAGITSSAQATKYYDSNFGGTGSGASATGGLFSTPRDIAVNQPSTPAQPQDGWIYVVDQANNRIQAFDADKQFQWAIGRNVIRASPTGGSIDLGNVFEKCTVAEDCQAGATGSLGGEFNTAQGIDIDQVTGHLFVRERNSNARVQEFTADGAFVRAFGWDVVQPGGAGENIVALDERETVTISPPLFGQVTGGSFTLSFGATAPTTTVSIDWEADAQEVQDALEGVGDIGPGDVEVSGGPGGANGATFTVDFIGALGGTDIEPPIAVGTNNLTGAGLFGPGTPSITIATAVNGGPSPGFETCTVASQCKAGTTGNLNGQFGSSSTADTTGVAVAPVGSAVAGHVFVIDPGNRRVQEFDVPANPTAAVALVDKLGDSSMFGSNLPRHVAVDAFGNAYAADGTGASGSITMYRYDAVANGFKSPILGGDDPDAVLGRSIVNGLEIDHATGHLFAGRNPSVPASVGILELDLSANPANVGASHLVGLSAGGLGLTANGIAVGSASGELLVTTTSNIPNAGTGSRVVVLDDTGIDPPPTVALLPPTSVGATTATFQATINPNATAGFPTFYRFELSKDGIDWAPVADEVSVGAGGSPVPVADDVTGLEANTFYRIRIRTTRQPAAGTAFSAELTFLTDPAPPTVETHDAQRVSDTTAQLAGRLNAGGLATDYWFEWGDDSYGNVIPAPASAIDGSTSKVIAEALAGLLPDTTYHFRLCAQNELAPSPVCGEDRQFATREAAAEAPAGRAYEMVSSPDKVLRRGGQSSTSGLDYGKLSTALPAVTGDRVLWSVFAGVADPEAGTGITLDYNPELRQRHPGGWLGEAVFNVPTAQGVSAPVTEPFAYSLDLGSQFWGVIPSPFGSTGGLATRVLGDSGGPLGGGWYPFNLSTGYGAIAGMTDDGKQIVVASNLLFEQDQGFRNVTPLDGGPAAAQLSPPQIAGQAILVGRDPTWQPTDLVNECTGTAGSNATQLPSRVGSGVPTDVIGTRDCETGSPTDVRGAGLGTGGRLRGTTTNMSHDGRRIFFSAPSPEVTGAGAITCSNGTGAATACPPQIFVRQYDGDGDAVVRWISRAEDSLSPQAIGAMGNGAGFEGASRDGSVIYLRTNAPLLVDDPNGGSDPQATASPKSWDLYRYELGADTDADPGAGDPGARLTRISGGPGADADPNTNCTSLAADCDGATGGNGQGGVVRFMSDDGQRVYFVTAAQIPGARNEPPSGGATTPTAADAQVNTSTRNVYLFDATKAGADAYEFVARVPWDGGGLDACLSSETSLTGPPHVVNPSNNNIATRGNCVHGSSSGDAIVFASAARLTSDDVDDAADVYVYDAAADRLERLSAPSPGASPYVCDTESDVSCNADLGMRPSGFSAMGGGGGSQYGFKGSRGWNVSEDSAGELASVFFESRLPFASDAAANTAMKVYEWQRVGGRTSLVSPSNSAESAFYSGNSRDGVDVFIWTEQRISGWEIDGADGDIYNATTRPDPIAEPGSAPHVCAVLAGGCHSGGTSPLPVLTKTMSSSGSPSGDNASPGVRKRLRVGSISRKARRRAARTGSLAVAVRVSGAGKVSAVAKGRVGKRARRVARKSVRVREAGKATLRLRLNRAARQRLSRGKALKLSIKVTSPGARSRSIAVRLPGGKS